MPRRRPDDKFQKVLDAAAAVFIEQGYRRTQMADVASAMGVAKGTLYLYVASKEALFDAALRYVDNEDAPSEPPSRLSRQAWSMSAPFVARRRDARSFRIRTFSSRRPASDSQPTECASDVMRTRVAAASAFLANPR